MLDIQQPVPETAAPSRWLRHVSWAGSVVVLGVAAWILQRYLTDIRWSDVAMAWSRLPAASIAGSLIAACISLCLLASFDVLAVRTVVPGRVSVGLAAFAGAVSHALSNTLGFHAFTGGAVRYRIYASAGLGAGDIARIVALAGLGVGLGFAVVTTAALCWEPTLSHGWGRLPGVLLFLLLAAMLPWLARRPRALQVGRWTLVFPRAPVAAAQMVIGGVEMLAAIGALYVLLPVGSAPAFIDFLPIYVGAVLAGIVSQSPGGLGVFEAIMLAAFPAAARADLLAAMLCYRVTYSLLPFALASVALAVFEIRSRRRSALTSTQFDGG